MGVEIPDDDTYKGFEPKEIIHARLTILPRAQSEPLEFGLEKVNTNGRLGIADYARDVVSSSFEKIAGASFKTPWDVGITQQCYVLFELDPGIPNWRFHKKGLVSKKKQDGKDFNLKWLDETGRSRKGTIDDRSLCRVVYFSVAERSKAKPSHGLDMYVEFTQDGGLRLPTVFDPDVKNEGGFDIP